jgi:hypothetical protein
MPTHIVDVKPNRKVKATVSRVAGTKPANGGVANHFGKGGGQQWKGGEREFASRLVPESEGIEMTVMAKPLERSFILSDGERVRKIGAFELDNRCLIECPGPVLSYLELQDRLIVVLHWYHASNLFNLCRNIFCYAKEDGHLIWQVEQPYGRDHQPLEAVYKYIKLQILQADGSYLDESDAFECMDGVIGETYLKPFRAGTDRLKTMTLCAFPSEYWIDYETGKVEWFAIHQKV